MATEEQPNAAPRMRLNQSPPTLLGKLVAFILGAAFLVLAFMFSLVALAVIAVAGLALWGWLWWKTRAVRKQMREQMHMSEPTPGAAAQRDGLIIEGEVVREETPPTRPERLLR